MSIFAKIRSGKKAAEQHKAQKAASEAAEAAKPAPTPYQHRPQHAAQDAITGTPGAADAEAIRQAHQRRSTVQRNAYYASSSPSLTRSHSEASMTSRTTASRAVLVDRRTHPGYASYHQSFSAGTPTTARSRRGSRHGKSPLASEPITPMDSQAASSASSFSSTRSYTDPIEPSAPFSERLETITSHQSTTSLRPAKPAPRVALYTPKTPAAPRPWEVAAEKRAKAKQAEVSVAEVTIEKPAAVATPNPKKHKSLMGLSRKQAVQVAAH